MKARINKINYNKYTTVCAVIGRYDENCNYSEATLENIKIKEFEKKIAKNIYLNHDITIQIAPREEIRVFAKSMKDIDEYLEIENDPNHIKAMLDCWRKNPKGNGDYIYTTIDLEEWKELRKLPPIEF